MSNSMHPGGLQAVRHSRRGTYAIAAVICALVLLAALLESLMLRADIVARVESRTQTLAASVTQTMDGQIDSIDVALLAAADEISRQKSSGKPDAAAIARYLVQQAGRLPRVAYLRATDDLGNLVYGPGLQGAVVNLSDREFFLVLRANPMVGLFMAKPVNSKMTGTALITFARRLQNADGSFGGTVFASIYLEDLQKMLSAIDIPQGGSLALRDHTLGLIVRHVSGAHNELAVGDNRVGQSFRQAFAQNTQSGTFRSDVGSADQVPRIYSFQRSEKYGFMTFVGALAEHELSGWRQQVVGVLALATLLCTAILLFARQVIAARERLLGVLDDVAGAQRQLELQERSHRQLLHNLHTGLMVHAPDGRVTFCNLQASRCLGRTMEQLLGSGVEGAQGWGLLDAQGTALAPALYPVRQVMASNAPYPPTVLGVGGQGRDALRWIEVSGFPECASDGALLQVVINLADVTRRVESDRVRSRVVRALRLLTDTNMIIARATQKQQLLADICHLICERGGYVMAWVGYAEHDAERMVRAVAHFGFDEGYLRELKVSWHEESAFGKGATGVAIRSGRTQVNRDYDDTPGMQPWRERARRSGFRSSIAIPFTKKSGIRGALMIYSAQVDAFNADEVELLEELSSNMAHGLDALDDHNRRLAAESVAQAKSNFLANMSHEIRTPLNTITGMAYLIRKDGLTPSQAGKLEKLEQAGRHLLGIITDILDLSKIDAGRMELESAPLTPQAIVDNVVSMLADRAAGRHIALHQQLEPMPRGLVGDATRLQQALLNYVSNALKFTHAGAVQIRASVAERTPQDALLRFEVSDTGIGIEAAVLARLFSDFEQADNSMTRKYGGTGLGLAITRRLAALMGGEAGAVSEPGVGSTFWFTARLRIAQAPQLPVAPGVGPQDDAAAVLRARHAGLRVLVAEDEPINSELMRILLEEVGFAVDCVEDGLAALEAAGRTPYGLIFMDMQMPRMNGLDATRRIRRMEVHARTVIIATTANAFVEDRRVCMEAGVTAFVTKPIVPQVLHAAILEAMQQASPVGAAGSPAEAADGAAG